MKLRKGHEISLIKKIPNNFREWILTMIILTLRILSEFWKFIYFYLLK